LTEDVLIWYEKPKFMRFYSLFSCYFNYKVEVYARSSGQSINNNIYWHHEVQP